MSSLYAAPQLSAFIQQTPTRNKPEINGAAARQTSNINRAARESLLQHEGWDSASLHLRIFVRVQGAVSKSGAFPFRGC